MDCFKVFEYNVCHSFHMNSFFLAEVLSSSSEFCFGHGLLIYVVFVSSSTGLKGLMDMGSCDNPSGFMGLERIMTWAK